MSKLEEREHTSLRIRKNMKETIRKLFPQAESFNEAHDLYLEFSEKLRKSVEPTTLEKPQDKTKSPQITDYTKEETLKLAENEIPPCQYASLTVRPSKLSKEGLEYLAFCDNPKKTSLPKNRLIPISACQKCYQREGKTEIVTLDFEHICKLFDMLSIQIKCKKVSEKRPLYRLPCFENYLEKETFGCNINECQIKTTKEFEGLFMVSQAMIGS